MTEESSLPQWIALGLITLHALQVALFASGMNLRTSIAILLFAGCVAFADRHASGRYTLPALQAFGVIGALFLMGFLQWTINE